MALVARGDSHLGVKMTGGRLIAELNDGSLSMAHGFIKASGGCSAPVGTDLEQALTRLGKMKLKVGGMAPAAQPLPTQLRISHPNITGMQLSRRHRYLD